MTEEKIIYPKFNLDIPKQGHILGVRRAEKDFFGSRIEATQLKAGYPPEVACYTHVEILSGGPHSMRIMPPRSKAIDIQKFYKGRHVKIMTLGDEAYERVYRYKVNALYNLLCNQRYDKRGILAFVFMFIKHDPRYYFCSEGVTEAIQRVYPIFLEYYPPEKTYPATVVYELQDNTVWEGTVE